MKRLTEQIDMLQNIVYDFRSKSVNIDDTLVVASLIKKNLPPSWSDLGRVLKQQPKDVSLDELLIALRIEEKHRENLNF